MLWLRFLQEIDEKTRTVSPELLAIPEVVEAIELAEQAAYTEGELEAYEQYWKSVSSEKTLINAALREGHAEGLEEGLAKGREESLLQVARNLLSHGLEIEFVSENTGLDIELLKKLKSNEKL